MMIKNCLKLSGSFDPSCRWLNIDKALSAYKKTVCTTNLDPIQVDQMTEGMTSMTF